MLKTASSISTAELTSVNRRPNPDSSIRSRFGGEQQAPVSLKENVSVYAHAHSIELSLIVSGGVALLAVAALIASTSAYVISSQTNGMIAERKLSESLQKLNLALTFDPLSDSARLNRAKVLAKLNRSKEALADYNTVLSHNPKDVKALEARAALCTVMNDYQQVIADCTTLIELQKSAPSMYTYANRAIAFSMSGRKQDALNDYTSAIRIKPSDPALYLGRADCYRDMRKFPEAIEDYKWVEELKPNSSDSILGEAQCWTLQRNFGKAQKSFDQAIEREPRNSQLYVERGKLFWAMKNVEDALKDFNKALSLNPKNNDALMQRMHVFVFKNDIARALRDVNRLAINGCRTYEMYIERANLEFKSGRYAIANLGYEKAAEMNPNDLQPLYQSALASEKLKHFSAAIFTVNDALKIKPDDVRLLCLRGRLNLEAGNMRSAEDDLNQAINLNSDALDAYMSRGLLLYKQEKFISAQQDFEKVLRNHPDNVDAKNCQSLCKIALKRSNGSGSYASSAVAVDNSVVGDEKFKAMVAHKDVKGLFDAGMTQYRGGNYSAAIKLMSQAVRINPSATAARRCLAASLLASNYGADAAVQFQSVIAQEPGNNSDLCGLASSYYQTHNYENAITAYEQYLSANPNDVDARCNLILAYKATGFTKKAKEICTQAIHDVTDVTALSKYENAMKQLNPQMTKKLDKTVKVLPNTEG